MTGPGAGVRCLRSIGERDLDQSWLATWLEFTIHVNLAAGLAVIDSSVERQHAQEYQAMHMVSQLTRNGARALEKYTRFMPVESLLVV